MSEGTTEFSTRSQEGGSVSQIKEIAQRLLSAVDTVTARHGWQHHTSEERDYRGTIWERVHTDRGPEGRIIKEALDKGTLKRQHPRDPDALLLNLRAAPGLDKLALPNSPQYREKANGVSWEILQEMGFPTPDSPEGKQLITKAVYEPEDPNGSYKSEKWDWLRGSMVEGAHSMGNRARVEFTEAKHPELPFAAYFLAPRDNEPDLVYIVPTKPQIPTH